MQKKKAQLNTAKLKALKRAAAAEEEEPSVIDINDASKLRIRAMPTIILYTKSPLYYVKGELNRAHVRTDSKTGLLKSSVKKHRKTRSLVSDKQL